MLHQQRMVLRELDHLEWQEGRLNKTTSPELALSPADFECLRRLKHEDGLEETAPASQTLLCFQRMRLLIRRKIHHQIGKIGLSDFSAHCTEYDLLRSYVREDPEQWASRRASWGGAWSCDKGACQLGTASAPGPAHHYITNLGHSPLTSFWLLFFKPKHQDCTSFSFFLIK